MSPSAKPLAGLKVIELGTLIAGPFASRICAEFGADVTKIESPDGGDPLAAPRVVSTAMVRDLFSGREMARVMSFVMMVFTLVPAVAPLMGQAVIYAAGWHAIFLVYVVFSIIILLWMGKI